MYKGTDWLFIMWFTKHTQGHWLVTGNQWCMLDGLVQLSKLIFLLMQGTFTGGWNYCVRIELWESSASDLTMYQSMTL